MDVSSSYPIFRQQNQIYLLKKDGSLEPLRESPYMSEEDFQILLEQYPDLLAGDQIDEDNPRRWLLISREVGIPSEYDETARWSLDHLFLDQDGIPTLVEVKRSSDTRIRREVVGQMLDYAANAVMYWPIETIRAKFEAYCEQHDIDPINQVLRLLNSGEGDGALVEEFWDKVATNLRAGKIRLVFVADEIPQELKRIVEFLNTQMNPAEVLAVEVKQFVGEGIRTLVPKVIGQTAGADRKKRPSGGKRWDEISFITTLRAQRGDREAEVAKRILEWAKVHMPSIWWGQGKKYGGFIPGIDHKGKWHQLIEVWTNGYVELQFQYMKTKSPPFDKRESRLEFLRRCNEISGVNIPEEAIEKRPSIPLSVLANKEALEQFLSVLEWAVREILSN